MRKTTFLIIALCVGGLFLASGVSAETEEQYKQQIRDLQKRNTQLENSLEDVTKQLNDANDKVKALQQQLAKMTAEAEEHIKEVEQTRQAMKDVKEQLTALLEQQSESGNGTQQELQSQLTEAKQRAERLQQDLKNAEERIIQQEQELQILKQQGGNQAQNQKIEALQGELDKLRTQYKANLALLQEREEALNQAYLQLNSEHPTDVPESEKVQALQEEITLLRALVKKQKEQIGTTGEGVGEGERVAELEAALAEANAKVLNFAQQNAELQAQVRQHQTSTSDIQGKDAEINRLEEELRKAAALINTNSEKMKQLTQANTDLKAQLAAAQQQTTAFSELQQEKTTLEAQLAATQQQTSALPELQQEKTTLETQLSQAQQQVSALQTQLSQLQTELHACQTESSNQAQRNSDLRNQLTTVQTKLETVQAELEAMTLQHTEATQQIANLERLLQEQGSVPEAARTRIKELSLEVQELKVQLDTQNRLEQEVPMLRQEATQLRQKMADLTQNQENTASLHSQLQEKNAALALELQEKEAALARTRQELDAVTTRNVELQNDLDVERTQRQTQTQSNTTLSTRNTELQQAYEEKINELDLKEQLLQKVLTEKALLEKRLEEQGAPMSSLQATLQQTEAQNMALQQQVKDLQREVASLNTQLLMRPESQPSVPPSPVQPQTMSLSSLFPREMFQGTNGKVTLLDWSPDRSKVAYQELTETRGRLWVLNTRTHQPVKITEWPLRTASSQPMFSRLSWAYDSRHFLFGVGSPGQYHLYVGGENQLLLGPIALRDEHIDFGWSPTRLQFAYFAGANLVVQEISGNTLPIQLGHSPGAEGTSLQWSPDGQRIVLSSKREASLDIYLLTLSGDKPVLQPLVTSPSDDVLPSWSPDGQYIAFYVRAKGYDAKLAVIPVNRSRAPYIVAHNVSVPSVDGPTWMTSSEIIYLGEEYLAASQNSLYRVDILTGRRSAVPLSTILSR